MFIDVSLIADIQLNMCYISFNYHKTGIINGQFRPKIQFYQNGFGKYRQEK